MLDVQKTASDVQYVRDYKKTVSEVQYVRDYIHSYSFVLPGPSPHQLPLFPSFLSAGMYMYVYTIAVIK